MATVNVAGWASKDGELQYTQSGTAILKFSIPENDKDGNATWFNCAVFGKQGETLAPMIKKGTPMSVSGRLNVRKYEQNGVEKTSIDVIVNEVKLLGGKKQESQEEKTDEPAF